MVSRLVSWLEGGKLSSSSRSVGGDKGDFYEAIIHAVVNGRKSARSGGDNYPYVFGDNNSPKSAKRRFKQSIKTFCGNQKLQKGNQKVGPSSRMFQDRRK
jgi:hypothetical protein